MSKAIQTDKSKDVTKLEGQSALKMHRKEDGSLEYRFDPDKKKCSYGTLDADLLAVLFNQIVNLGYTGDTDTKESEESELSRINSGFAFVAELNPQDLVEALLASQMYAVQTLSMNLASRAVMKDQNYDIESHNINQAVKLMRTYTVQMEALSKYRTKGQQKITVQHVNVNDGGQAVVGDINQGVGNE